MYFNRLFLLALPSLISALPSTLIVRNPLAGLTKPHPRGLVKVGSLPYPDGQSQGTCPDTTNGNNPLNSPLEPPNKKRRSLPGDSSSTFFTPSAKTTTPLAPRNGLCNEIAYNGAISNFPNQVGNTASLTLRAGIGYVLSFAFDTYVSSITAWVNDANGHFHQLTSQSFGNTATGQFSFNVPSGSDLSMHFEIFFQSNFWGWDGDVNGQIGLFQLWQG